MATQVVTETMPFEEPVHVPMKRKSDETDSPAVVVSSDPKPEAPSMTRAQTIIAIIQLSGLSLFSSFSNGIVVIGLPAIATDLHIGENLLLWPTSVFYLTAGSTLLLAGSVADVVGPKRVNLAGSLLSAAFSLAAGFARTGNDIIAFRAIQGVANAIIVPSAISIASTNMKDGRPRNLGFACLGLAQPIGFSLGLVLGGVFVDTTGWRTAFYFSGAATFALLLVGFWALPKDHSQSSKSPWERLISDIDWVGAIVASTGLATLSYVLSTLSADVNNIRQASSIALLVISGLSLPAFIGWMHYQVKRDRVALIPNSLWRSYVFVSCCIMVLISTSVTNTMELYASLFFQNVQKISALGASIRILPSLIAGALINLSTGLFINRMPVVWPVLVSSLLSAGGTLLMALIDPAWPYWYDAFFAQVLTPLSCDILFTVGLLVISDVFPSHMQGLSGAVFQTCAQLGTAIGLSVTSVVSIAVTNDSGYDDKESPDALLVGYRVVFYILFGLMVVVSFVSIFGLRKVGVIGGKKRD
ncbi:MFS general substrate transporter [Astrocystis sublimbata]|nr:MFS general substrate transporter [Astrocystis sublimbata]